MIKSWPYFNGPVAVLSLLIIKVIHYYHRQLRSLIKSVVTSGTLLSARTFFHLYLTTFSTKKVSFDLGGKEEQIGIWFRKVLKVAFNYLLSFSVMKQYQI